VQDIRWKIKRPDSRHRFQTIKRALLALPSSAARLAGRRDKLAELRCVPFISFEKDGAERAAHAFREILAY